uniref:Uncharacterized protein n=1 Tax=Cucumis sativus TaxID=3659 RepID=A0A0A0KT47_CUCSA
MGQRKVQGPESGVRSPQDLSYVRSPQSAGFILRPESGGFLSVGLSIRLHLALLVVSVLENPKTKARRQAQRSWPTPWYNKISPPF